MNRVRQTFVGIAAVGVLIAKPLFASGTDPVPVEEAAWEFGFQGGIANPIGNKHLTVQAFNNVFLNSDPDTPGENEFPESGLPTPDFNAVSTIDGNIQPAGYVGGHCYYHLLPAIGIGLEGSATIERSVQIKSAGAFNTPLYAVNYQSNGGQLVAAIRLGGWVGPIRPFVMAGMGPYWLHRYVTATLLDSADDPTPPRILLAGHSDDAFLSTLFGGGIDFALGAYGSIGLGLQYQRIFMPINNLQYVIPNIRFDAHF